MTAETPWTPPHHEPPDRARVDLRLAVPALAVWVTAWVLVPAPVEVAGTVGVIAVLGAAFAVLRTGRRRGPGPSTVLTCGVLAVLALHCAARTTAREAGGLPELIEARARVELIGTVRSSEPTSAGTSRVLVALTALRPVDEWVPSGAAVQLFVPDGLPVGATVQFTASLSPSRGLHDRAAATVRPHDSVRVRAGPGALDRMMAGRRAALVELAADLPGDAGALVPGMAVGDTSGAEQIGTAMKGSGLAHLTAVSGAHFGMVGATVLALVSRIGVSRRIRWLPSAAAGTLFVLLVGPGPTVVRAAWMGAVGVLGATLGRPPRVVPALSATVLVLLLVDPWLCADIGFVLSVAATAGIATLSAPLSALVGDVWARSADRIGRRGTPGGFRLRRALASPPVDAGRSGPSSATALAVAVPVAAQAVCAPVILLLDPAVPLYAVPANLLAAPAVAPATLAGLVAALTAGWCPIVAELAVAISGVGCGWIGLVARTCVGLPGARVSWLAGWPGLLTLATATAAGVALLLRCRRGMAP